MGSRSRDAEGRGYGLMVVAGSLEGVGCHRGSDRCCKTEASTHIHFKVKQLLTRRSWNGPTKGCHYFPY